MNRPRPVVAGAVLAAIALAAVGCGDSAPVNPGPTPTAPPPARAGVVMTIGGVVLLCENTEKIKAPYTCKVRSNIRFNEYNGVAATVQSIRLDMFQPGGAFIERNQIEARDLPGGAVIPARGAKDYIELDLYFSAAPTPGRYVVIIANVKDDAGYGTELQSGRLGF